MLTIDPWKAKNGGQLTRLWGEVKKSYTHFQSGDVLVAKVTPCFENGKAGVAIGLPNGIGAGSSEFCVFRVHAGINPRYLLGWFSTENFRRRAAVEMTGSVGLKRVPKGTFLSEQLPLAPTAEQTRIADKLDTVLTRVDACRDRLARVAPLLKRFRQSVLAAATSGRLTEDWRTANPHSPGYSKTELNQHRAAIKNRLKVPRAPACLEDGLLYSLPVSWSWVLNHELARDNSNSICAGPFGTIFKAADFRSSGIPIIFLRHVSEGRYLTSKPGFMDSAVWNEFHRPYSVHGGELLVTKLGDPPGTACIYPKNIGVAMVTPDVLKMDVDADAADVAYLMYFFNSPNAKRIIESMCFGVTRLRIDMAMFKSFPIPLPPRLEQTEIVRRVETLFAFADRLEARLKTAQTAADRLTPALLAKAFRGELVPQDPNDEPAAELLKRLAASRDAAPKAKRGRRSATADTTP